MKNLYLWISATCSVDRWAWKRDSPLFSGFSITSWNWNVETPSECPLGYLPCHIRYYTMVYTYYLWTCILEHDHNTWDTMFASEQGWPPFEAEILSPLWPRYLVKLLLGLEVWVLFFDEVIEDFGQSKLYRNLLPAKDKPIQFASWVTWVENTNFFQRLSPLGAY